MRRPTYTCHISGDLFTPAPGLVKLVLAGLYSINDAYATPMRCSSTLYSYGHEIDQAGCVECLVDSQRRGLSYAEGLRV